MSTFKVGDVVQQIKEPRSVGVVVKIGRRWLVHRWEPDYIVAKLETARYDNYFAEQIQAYAYKTVNKDDYTKHQTGDLITFHRKSSSGYPYLNTYYVGPKEDIRIIDDITFYPYINWEDHNVYYATYDWTGIQEIVKPKFQIGALVKIGSDKAFPIVKIVYDRPYETHVYTLENGSNISGKNLNNYDWNRETNSWQHKDVKPVVEPVKETATEKQFKVGDVVQDRRVDNGDGIGVVLKAEYPRYTVNWVVIDNATADWAEKLVYRDNLKSYFHKSVRNTSAGRKVNCVLGVSTTKGKEFYQIAASEVKVIDGTWYYPYVNLQTSELRYGRYYWKDPDERLYPEFKLGDKLVLTSALDIKLITAVSFDIPTKKFSYCVNEGWGYILEEHLSTFKKQGDTWYHPSVLEQKEKNQPLSSDPTITMTVNGEEKVFEPAFKDVRGDCETADLTSDPVKNFDISYVSSPAVKPTVLVTNPELAKKISGCKDSTGSVFVFGKEEFVGEPFNQTAHKIESFSNIYDQIKKDFVENPSKYGPPIVVDPKAYKEQVKTIDSIEEKGSVLSSNPTLTVTVNGKERVFEPAFKDLWRDTETTDLTSNPFTGEDITYALGDPKTIAKLELSAPSTNEYSDTFFNKHDQIEKTITSELLKQDAHIRNLFIENSVKDTKPKGVKMNLSPVNARVIRLRSVRLLDSLSKKFFLERFPDDVSNFKIVGNLIDSKVPAALVLSLAGFSCKYGLPKAPTDIKPIVETLQKEFTEESQAMLTNSQLGVLKLIGDEVITSLISLVKEHVTDNDI